MTSTSKRYETIDFVRGFALINMFLYHGIYDLVYIFNVDIPWFTSKEAYYWQQMICMLFIILAGASASFSRNLLKHGFKVLVGGLIISVTTMVAMPSQFVSFGILHFMGISMILLSIFRKYIDKFSPILGFGIAMAFFIVTKRIPGRYLGIGDIPLLPLPNSLYQSDYLYAFGFPNSRFSSVDYFPLLPWLFLFLAGYTFWNLIKNSQFIEKYGHFQVVGINYIGKHTLLLYLLHQPFIYSLIFLILNILPLLNF